MPSTSLPSSLLFAQGTFTYYGKVKKVAKEVEGEIGAGYRPCAPELAAGHRVGRPRGTGSVGDSVGEGEADGGEAGQACVEVEQAAVEDGVSKIARLEEQLRSGQALLARSLAPLSQNAQREAALHSPLPDQIWGMP